MGHCPSGVSRSGSSGSSSSGSGRGLSSADYQALRGGRSFGGRGRGFGRGNGKRKNFLRKTQLLWINNL